MYLVDDIDAVLRSCGSKGDLVDDRADIVDTAVGCGVHLNDVEDLAAVDTATIRALAAGITVADVKAVDRLRKDLRAGGFARTARTGEQIGVMHAVHAQLVAQRRRHMILTVYVVK